MPSNILSLNISRANLLPFIIPLTPSSIILLKLIIDGLLIVVFIITPILMAVTSIPLIKIVLLEFFWLACIEYLDYKYICRKINYGVPIAKVVWTQHWEIESKVLINRFNLDSINALNLTYAQIRYFANYWDELHVKKINNNPLVLYNYKHSQPVIGVLL